MAIELRHSNFEDPFGGCSLLSLLPRTLGESSYGGTAASEAEELGSIRSFFKSMALKRSAEVVEQAQTISKNVSNVQNLDSEDGNKGVVADKGHPQGRRPALGRKRARFSLKPASTHSLPNVDFRSSIDHIEDPEEFFMAYEQLENADKELKKLRGEVSADLMQQHQSTTTRKRRPGLLGKTASYKHQFSVNANTAEALVESQEESPGRGISSLLKTSTDADLTNVSLSEAISGPGTSQKRIADGEHLNAAELEGSVADMEKKVGNLLENLLSSYKDLDDDEGSTLLREKFQFKSIDVGKIHLPHLASIQSIDHSPFNRARRGELKGSPHSHISPNQSSRPFAAISTLQKHISLKDALEDVYSITPSDDVAHSGDYSLSRGSDRESLSSAQINHHNKSALVIDGVPPAVENGTLLSFEDMLHPAIAEADKIIGNEITSEGDFSEHPCNAHDEIRDNDSGRVDNGRDVSSRPDSGLQEEGNNVQLDPVISDQQDAGVEGLASGSINTTVTESFSSQPSRNMSKNDNSSGINVDACSFGPDDTLRVKVNSMVQAHILTAEASRDNSRPSEAILLNDQNLKDVCSLPEENNEGHQTVRRASLKRGEKQRTPPRKAPPRGPKKQKPTSGRQSLADAGLVWQSGVRRSSRIRVRPLQHWRGERLLYGRIHDSLATVIGIKYSSPEKDGKGSVLKVKSFVSEEYAELVAQAGVC